MLGKKSVLDSLAAKRQALIAESDSNRRQLAQEWESLKTEAARLARPVQKARRYLLAGSKAVNAFLALRRVWTETRNEDGKRNWTATLLQVARIGISMWPALRAVGR